MRIQVDVWLKWSMIFKADWYWAKNTIFHRVQYVLVNNIYLNIKFHYQIIDFNVIDKLKSGSHLIKKILL